MPSQTILLEQGRETKISAVQCRGWQFRYGYARSGESQSAMETGQDGLCLRYKDDRILFALCDGVGMSFMGNLAANFLCQYLVDWLDASHPFEMGAQELPQRLAAFLMDLTRPASKIVAEYCLPDGLAPMFLSVLEEKRIMGSESMFASGVVDLATRRFLLAWMGDSRLRLWCGANERTVELLGNTINTRERWSTRRGAIGTVHAFEAKLDEITRLAVYSDGFAVLDGKMETPYSTSTLNQLTEAVGRTPNSDDITFLEIMIEPEGRA